MNEVAADRAWRLRILRQWRRGEGHGERKKPRPRLLLPKATRHRHHWLANRDSRSGRCRLRSAAATFTPSPSCGAVAASVARLPTRTLLYYYYNTQRHDAYVVIVIVVIIFRSCTVRRIQYAHYCYLYNALFCYCCAVYTSMYLYTIYSCSSSECVDLVHAYRYVTVPIMRAPTRL